jgi:iron complex outermembrane receptor protein
MDVRVGYRHRFSKKFSIEIWAGAGNIGDATYSLGNDINAFGDRYYNAAPGRNYYGGILLRPLF